VGVVGLLAALAAVMASPVSPTASAGTAAGTLGFSTTPLIQPDGGSEPEISIGPTGTMGIVGLQWLHHPPLGTHLWTGPFGSTPAFQGLVDADLQQQPSKLVLGSGDADVDIGSTGTVHITTLIGLVNPNFKGAGQTGVAAITCPNASSATFSISDCTRQIIGTTTSDRPWITSEGSHVYISYNDPYQASLIDVKRSDDDGYTWQRVGDPVVGQGGATADATVDNTEGKLVADPVTHDVFDIYAFGVTGQLKGTFTQNQIIVSRGTDMGQTWTANLVYQAPAGTSLAHIFPALAVDPTNGNLYAAWSDGHNVSFSMSSDHGGHWSPAVTVNTAPAGTAVEPWLAAYNGTVDVVYYGTNTVNDTSAVWNVYLAQTANGGAAFTQSLVSDHPNHVGVICSGGAACPPGTRNLLDLFQVAIDPQSGKAAIVYTDDTLTTTSSTRSLSCYPGETICPLPQLALAQQK
jgi:hypothetical protein